MIWAADKGGKASSTIQASASISHTNSGILMSVIPGQRMEITVAITLIALVVLGHIVMERAARHPPVWLG